MSTQKGNNSRSRPPKHQNKFAFKNNLYDTSKRTKQINSIQVNNVCDRCKSIIEWKIKYKKYKLMKNPSTCCKCHNKCVKEPYHTICGPCSTNLNVCPKCGKDKGEVSNVAVNNDSNDIDRVNSNDVDVSGGGDDYDDDSDFDLSEDD